jgi:hypothetical protein
VTPLALERVVERGALHGRRRSAAEEEGEDEAVPAHYDFVATPTTIATEQCTARLFVPKHHRRSLFLDV